MEKKLLPNYSKKFALPAAVICIVSLIFTGPLAASIQVDENVVEWILKDLLLLSLVVIVLSREKEETQEIHKIRIRGLIEAIGFGVVVLIYDSVSNIFYQNGLEEMRSGYELMLMMLSYYLFFFFIKKNIKPARA